MATLLQWAIAILLNCYIVTLFVGKVFAVDISLSNLPSIISVESFTLTASISGAKAGTNYLRVDLFKEGSTSYFGETFNGNEWYSGSEYNQYLPATINSGVPWIGEIKGQVGDKIVDSGQYKLRVRRYTSQNSYSYSDPVNVNISIPTPTPTQTPTPTPEPTDTPSPTRTPTPTLTPTLTPKPTITIKPSLPQSTSSATTMPVSIFNLAEASPSEKVLGETTVNNKTLFKKLAAISLIFSLLTIGAVLLKIKKG